MLTRIQKKTVRIEAQIQTERNGLFKSKQNESFWLKKASGSKRSKTDPFERNKGNTIYINKSGLYSLILRSKLESARAFKRWVT